MHEAVDQPHRRSQLGYRLFAPVYDLVFGSSLQAGRRLAIAALDARPGERILEVGVGSGLSLSMYPLDAFVVGIDISSDMLSRARRRIDRAQSSNMQTLFRMDVERLAFADARFDKAVVMYALSGFPEPVRAMAEIQRVCKPGATLVLVNRFRSSRPVTRLADILLAPIFRLLSYRADLDIEAFLQASNLQLLDRKPANLFGYSTVLVCRTFGSTGSGPLPAIPFDLAADQTPAARN
ncbi:MAG: methyltransferase domain-containing protein [Gammaproteobacteria bacterium]|jgi:phosphatidylethanolamine/phosphatidyl-N-methylethanolamine N-methyltransferase